MGGALVARPLCAKRNYLRLMRENKKNNITTIEIVIPTLLTLLPLSGIFLISYIWLKAILLIFIVAVLQKYWAHPSYTSVNSNRIKIGIVLNLLLLSGFFLFYPNKMSYIFIFLIVLGLLTMKGILIKY